VFRLMTCEAYYQTHPDPNPAMGTDRCSIHEIEAGTAKAVSLLGASTTLFGVINLFVTGWMIKHLGIKWGLLISIFWPAVRLAIQNVGVMVGGSKGIIIVQSSQIVTVLGGPGGYVFALNSYITEILEPSRRTGALGMLQGCSFIGTATAYLIGGMISDNFGILAPFRLTLILFLTSCIYVLFSLPSIPPIGHKTKDLKSALADFFGPMKIFTPQKWVLKEGRMEMQYGTILLGIGAFLAVLATGYIPILLQMIATGSYNFSTTENGYLISLNCLIRGLFLSLVFPRLISVGRSYHAKQRMSRKNQDHSSPESGILDLPHTANDFAAVKITNTEGEPIEPTKQHNEQETFDFDLTYARYSLLADGLLTGAATFVSRGWQMYLVSAILPLAAGTGSAAKGTILQMCSPADRADALGAITLVEMIARLVSCKRSPIAENRYIPIDQQLTNFDSERFWAYFCCICGVWKHLFGVCMQWSELQHHRALKHDPGLICVTGRCNDRILYTNIRSISA
jgi:MFS family permease